MGHLKAEYLDINKIMSRLQYFVGLYFLAYFFSCGQTTPVKKKVGVLFEGQMLDCLCDYVGKKRHGKNLCLDSLGNLFLRVLKKVCHPQKP